MDGNKGKEGSEEIPQREELCVTEIRSLVIVYQPVLEQASQCNLLQERALGSSFSDKVLIDWKST